jgi:hypothetical protein
MSWISLAKSVAFEPGSRLPSTSFALVPFPWMPLLFFGVAE